MPRTQVIVEFEHPEGTDPLKWKFPTSMKIGDNQSAKIINVSVPPNKDAEKYTLVPEVTIKLGQKMIDSPSNDADVQDAIQAFFGQNSEQLVVSLRPLTDQGIIFGDIKYKLFDESGNEAGVFDADGDLVVFEDASAESTRTRPQNNQPIIVRLSASSIDEVAFPDGYDGPSIRIEDYDAGSQIRVQNNKPLPSGYEKTLIGVCKVDMKHPK